VSEECFPYTSGTTNVTGDCLISSKACVDKSVTFHKYKSTQPKSLAQGDYTAIQNALMTGPVMSTMYVYDDFINYIKGIYIRTGGSNFLGGHAVKTVGWGHDLKTSIDYWIVANSWGASWGENGYFRIKMGEVLIDSADTYGDPSIH
jgi:cathepsin B